MTTCIYHPPALLLAAAALLVAAPVRAEQEAPRCKYVQTAKLPVRYVDQSLVPAIDATLNGEPAVMAIDTRAATNFLTLTGAAKHRLELRKDQTYIVGKGGRSSAYWAKLNDMSAGGAHTGKGDMVVIGDTTGPVWFDGIISAPFLFQADLELDLANKQIKFFRAAESGCEDSFLAYWDPEATMVLPVARYRNYPVFSVELNGHRLDAIIDTGAAHSYVDREEAVRIGVKLDAPGVVKLPDLTTIGTSKVERWRATFDKLQIGQETIDRPVLEVVDSKLSGAGLFLGADYLRAHRLLFAPTQGKLYISYNGGEVFSRTGGIEPWMQQEADAGNADAQYRLANEHASAGNRDQAAAWLRKAAASGQPHANLQLGRILMLEGRFTDAAAHLRGALDKLPSERTGALWLYLSRVRSGQLDLAMRELENSFSADPVRVRTDALTAFFRGDGEPAWPAPVADFFLGRIDAGTLLAKAKKQDDPRARVCDAQAFMHAWHTARGETAAAASSAAAMRESCGTVVLLPERSADRQQTGAL